MNPGISLKLLESRGGNLTLDSQNMHRYGVVKNDFCGDKKEN